MSFTRVLNVRGFVDGVVRDELRRVAQKVHRDLTNETPVDTALASAGWLVSLETVDNTVTTGTNRTASELRANGKIKRAKPYEALFIQNNLPYIGKLNDGHSDQAPKKYVERIMARASLG